MGKRKALKTVGVAATILGGIATATYYVLKHPGVPEKYSRKWMEALSDKDWEKEREIVRQLWCKGKTMIDGMQIEPILNLFDMVKRERESDGKPIGFPVHGEHGWYLPSD